MLDQLNVAKLPAAIKLDDTDNVIVGAGVVYSTAIRSVGVAVVVWSVAGVAGWLSVDVAGVVVWSVVDDVEEVSEVGATVWSVVGVGVTGVVA